MVTYVLVVYLAIHLAFLIWSFRFAGPASPRLWILRLMLAGMIYDNLMLSVGNLAVGSSWYVTATIGRFALHAALLPLLIPFALSAMRACAIPLAHRHLFAACCWLLAAAAWWHGLSHDLGQLELAPQAVLGHLRLVSVSELPPLGTIAVNLLLVPLAFILWRRTGWPLLLLGTLFILLLNGSVGTRPWGFVAGNGAEVIFVLCLLLTERFLIGRARTATLDPPVPS